ncbi:uncharacterized protein PFL1_00674 [Pseudozyma flocculosa PF-1]|uniref:SAP domain-containing protein n=1 Tax=Pseudozyma flocculosa TaxID=84751 RepID=A0A5C3ERQ7_9BASI|nr:uncharacterized protein PFL1_00674 [Pseudozyma flocculosa PF-1]EPQ32480.1 hypothetical protein PFL1_00674 [Pseudozyma flocculosa PF-1]SPO34530.1 uncharacterized protein PSFLO_00001 [Pseudozyma flocculosa]
MLRSVASAANLRARSASSVSASAVASSPAHALFRRNLVSSVLLSSTRDAYEKKRIAELRDDLRSRGLSSSGKKEDLVRRLLDNDSARAGSNLTQSASPSPSHSSSQRAKSTLASLRSQPPAAAAIGKATPKTEASKPTLGGDDAKPQPAASTPASNPAPSAAQDAAQATADAVAEAGSPLGSLKPSETPSDLTAGTVHSAAADGLASGETAKSSPDAAPEDPAIATNPPGLPPHKAPHPRETFNIQIPYYEEPAEPEAPIPLVTSYTSLRGKPEARNEPEHETSPDAKVFSISATGDVSHSSTDLSSQSDDAAAAESKGLLAEILADLQGGNTSSAAHKANKAASKTADAASGAFGSIAAQAKGVLSSATQSFAQAAESSSSSSSSSNSGGGASSGRRANRPLTDDERTGAWILLGIVGGGFLLGGLGKPKKHDESSDRVAPLTKSSSASAAPAQQQQQKPQQTAAAVVAAEQPAVPAPSVATVEVPVVVVPVPVPAAAAAAKGGAPRARAQPAERLSEASLAQLSRLSTCEVSNK